MFSQLVVEVFGLKGGVDQRRFELLDVRESLPKASFVSVFNCGKFEVLMQFVGWALKEGIDEPHASSVEGC